MMPTVLLEVDGANNASPALGTVLRELGDIEQAARKLNNAFPTATRVTNFGKAIDGLKGQVGNLPAEFTTLASTADAALNQVIAKFRDVEAAITGVQTKTRAAAGDIRDMGTAAGKLNSAFPTATRVTNFEAAIQALQGKIGTLPTEFTDLAIAADTALTTIIGKFGQVEAAIGVVTAAIRTQAQAYGQLAGQMKGLPTPPPPPSTGTSTTGSSGGHGGISGAIRNFALYAGGYGAAYAAYGQFKESLGRDITYSRAEGALQAETGLSTRQTQQLSNMTRAQAGSGNIPYNAQTLLAGEYTLASLDIGKATPSPTKALFDINTIAAKMSAGANAPDTSQATSALTSIIADFQLNNKNVVANTARVADQLQVAVKLGKAELPDFAQQVAVPSQLAGRMGVSTSDTLAYLAAESAGGLPTGELGGSLNALLASSQTPTQQQRNVANQLGIQYDASFWGKHGLTGGLNLIEQHMAVQGENPAQQATTLARLFGNKAVSKGVGSALAGGFFDISGQVQNSGGAVQQAYSTSQAYAGNKLADAEAKLATKFDDLTTLALPALVKAADSAATALDGITLGLGTFGTFLDQHFGKGTAQDVGSNIASGIFSRIIGGPGGGLSSIVSAVQAVSSIGGGSGGTTATAAPQHGRYDATWYKTMGIPLGGENQAGYAPGQAPKYTAAWYQAMGIPLGGANQVGSAPGRAIPQDSTRAAPFQVPTTSTARTGGAQDNYAATYRGGTGAQSPAYLAAAQPGRGSAQPQAVRDALTTLKDDITQKLSASIVDSAFAAYKEAVQSTPLLSDVTKRDDLVRAQKLVDKYEQGGTAVSRIPKQLPTAQPGPGALIAGNENTAVRFAGQQDPLVLENRLLRRELDQANNRIAALLTEIRDNVKAAFSGSPARPNPQKSYGARGTKH